MKAFLFSILLCFISLNSIYGQFSGGSGTEQDPYQISTIEQLQYIGQIENLSKHFILANNIDASMTKTWNDSLGFKPIGDVFDKFTGSLDGNEKQISNISINRPLSNNIAIFAFINGAVISNLILTNAAISGNDYVATVVANTENSSLNNVHITCSITSKGVSGGIIASNNSTPVSYCSATILNSTTNWREFGGLIGRNNSILSYSYTKGYINGSGLVGGSHFSGEGQTAGAINFCYSEATIQNGSGLVGHISIGTLRNSMFHGKFINGRGGLVGWLSTNASINQCLAVISDSSSVLGGL